MNCKDALTAVAVGLFWGFTSISSAQLPVTDGLVCSFDASLGVTTDGGGVITAWLDQSGSNHHVTAVHGAPTLVSGAVNGKPEIQFRGNDDYMELAGTFFAKEMYFVVRSPSATWSGSGSFLGRPDYQLESSFAVKAGQTYFNTNFNPPRWLPTSVNRNGSPMSKAGANPGHAFDLGRITEYMVLRIVANDDDPTAAAYTIGKTKNSIVDFDVAEIIGYGEELTPTEEDQVTAYLLAKYSIGVPEFSITTLNTAAAATGAEIQNDGTLVRAVFYGGRDGGWGSVGDPSIEVNGVTFTNGTDGTDFTDSAVTINWIAGDTEAVVFAPTGGAHTDYQQLIKSALRRTGANWFNMSISFGGLVVGNDYRLQLISTRPDGLYGHVQFPGFGPMTNSLDGAVAQMLTATWTAQCDTLDFFEGPSFRSTWAPTFRHQICGYALHDVSPGPAGTVVSIY